MFPTLKPRVSAVVVPMSRKRETWGILRVMAPSIDNTPRRDLRLPAEKSPHSSRNRA